MYSYYYWPTSIFLDHGILPALYICLSCSVLFMFRCYIHKAACCMFTYTHIKGFDAHFHWEKNIVHMTHPICLWTCMLDSQMDGVFYSYMQGICNFRLGINLLLAGWATKMRNKTVIKYNRFLRREWMHEWNIACPSSTLWLMVKETKFQYIYIP